MDPESDPEAYADQRWRCLQQGRFDHDGSWMSTEEANEISTMALFPNQTITTSTLSTWKGDHDFAWGHPNCRPCALDPSFDKTAWCSVMARLNIRSLFAVGDSLQASFCNALGGILGISLWMAANSINNTIHCPANHDSSLPASWLYRHDEFNVDFQYAGDYELFLYNQKTDTWLIRWLDLYEQALSKVDKSKGERMLFLANAGPHFHSVDSFNQTFHIAADWIQNEFLNKGNGIAVWRNTPTGHHECEKYDAPISVEEYQQTFGNDAWMLRHEHEEEYTWRLFARYNDITSALLSSDYVCVRQLDVVSSTRLRPDHHKSPGTDCLHYPERPPNGPTMEWNRLLYAHLDAIGRSADWDDCL